MLDGQEAISRVEKYIELVQLSAEANSHVQQEKFFELVISWSQRAHHLRSQSESVPAYDAQLVKACAVTLEVCIRELSQVLGLRTKGDYVL